jgi:hypothetical protein
MNDDNKAAMDLADSLANHGGWFAALVAGSYGWILKAGLGRAGKTLDRIEAKLDDHGQRLSRLEGRMESEE